MCQHDPAFTNDSICFICRRDRVAAAAVDVLEASAQRREARLSAADIAEMEARCAETATEAPSYDGMWK